MNLDLELIFYISDDLRNVRARFLFSYYWKYE